MAGASSGEVPELSAREARAHGATGAGGRAGTGAD